MKRQWRVEIITQCLAFRLFGKNIPIRPSKVYLMPDDDLGELRVQVTGGKLSQRKALAFSLRDSLNQTPAD